MYALCKNVSDILTNFCIHFVYKLYTKCIQNISIQNVSHILTNVFIQNVYKIFVYKMYAKYLYTKCLPHFENILYAFCIQNLVGVVF